MAVLKACGLKLDFDEVYEDYQKIYDKTMEMQRDKKNERVKVAEAGHDSVP